MVLCITASFMNITSIALFQSPVNASHYAYDLFNIKKPFLIQLNTDQHSTKITRNEIKAYISILKDENKKLFYMKYNNDKYSLLKLFKSFILFKPIRFMRYLHLGISILYKRRRESLIKSTELPDYFGYFALHLQPELTTSTLGFGLYQNQLLALRHFSNLCRNNDMDVIVKENPKQSPSHRELFFYKEICELPNVHFVTEGHSIDYIKQSQVVATITGTVGLEALSFGKHVICYGNSFYKDFDGVHNPSEFYSDPTFKIQPITSLQKSLEAIQAKSCPGCSDKNYLSPMNIEKDLNNDYLVSSITKLINYQSSFISS